VRIHSKGEDISEGSGRGEPDNWAGRNGDRAGGRRGFIDAVVGIKSVLEAELGTGKKYELACASCSALTQTGVHQGGVPMGQTPPLGFFEELM
jgi:hypothetical protein